MRKLEPLRDGPDIAAGGERAPAMTGKSRGKLSSGTAYTRGISGRGRGTMQRLMHKFLLAVPLIQARWRTNTGHRARYHAWTATAQTLSKIE